MPRPLAERIFMTASTDPGQDSLRFVRFHEQQGPQQVNWFSVPIIWFIGIKTPPHIFTNFRLDSKIRNPPCIERFSSSSSVTAHYLSTECFELFCRNVGCKSWLLAWRCGSALYRPLRPSGCHCKQQRIQNNEAKQATQGALKLQGALNLRMPLNQQGRLQWQTWGKRAWGKPP